MGVVKWQPPPLPIYLKPYAGMIGWWVKELVPILSPHSFCISPNDNKAGKPRQFGAWYGEGLPAQLWCGDWPCLSLCSLANCLPVHGNCLHHPSTSSHALGWSADGLRNQLHHIPHPFLPHHPAARKSKLKPALWFRPERLEDLPAPYQFNIHIGACSNCSSSHVHGLKDFGGKGVEGRQ